MDDLTIPELMRLRDLVEAAIAKGSGRALDVRMLHRIKEELARRAHIKASRQPLQRTACLLCSRAIAFRGGRRFGKLARHRCSHGNDCQSVRIRGEHMPSCRECRTPEQLRHSMPKLEGGRDGTT